jgi:hypothetical protein
MGDGTGGAIGMGAGMGAGIGAGAGAAAAGAPMPGRKFAVAIPAPPPMFGGGCATVDAIGAGAAAFTPCGGVSDVNGFGAASRGSSAPHPRQNL